MAADLENELHAEDASSFDKRAWENLRNLERNSKDLERNLRGLERNSSSLGLGILAQDGRRALEISFIVFHNKGFDVWA